MSRIHWVARGTGTPEDTDEVNIRELLPHLNREFVIVDGRCADGHLSRLSRENTFVCQMWMTNNVDDEESY